MSPRKSSTSSGRSVPRPRYLAIEVAGDQPFSPRWLEAALAHRLVQSTGPILGRLRIIRAEGRRVIVEVPHRFALRARSAWTGDWTTAQGVALRTSTHRTFGTLVKGKDWVRGPRGGRPARRPREV